MEAEDRVEAEAGWESLSLASKERLGLLPRA